MTCAPIDDPAALTHHIETRYHAGHRQQLPELERLADLVETVHFSDETAPRGLAELLSRLVGEMEVHMKKEELILFPMIRKGGAPGIDRPIAAMRADHDDHGDEIAQIRKLTDDLTLPEGACRTWTALYDGLGRFIADLEEHIRLENEVLFPQFETR
ncbi:hemerythrin domain-containing protein [Acidimangrovimonas pyrenivorans]|uniref:Hemerythrin domain-containing protein n=1 Tax=Acidimangrovimonas pyrenivorans TaxID=2030798 RepID=A0ABV7AF06_9RHOB